MEYLIIGLYILFGIGSFAVVITAVLTILKVLNLYTLNLNYSLLWTVSSLMILIPVISLIILGYLNN